MNPYPKLQQYKYTYQFIREGATYTNTKYALHSSFPCEHEQASVLHSISLYFEEPKLIKVTKVEPKP